MEVYINPTNITEEYIANLNLCFGGWGDINLYNWCFKRKIGLLSPDILVIKQQEKIVSGSGIVYRKLILPGGQQIDTGFIVGTWTLPIARGQGCFTKIIQTSLDIAKSKGCAFLLSFVTEENASYRKLIDLGTLFIPTYYCIASPTPKINNSYNTFEIPQSDSIIEYIYNHHQNIPTAMYRLGYSLEEWRRQFLERPGKVQIISIEDRAYAIVQKMESVYRVLMIVENKEMNFNQCIEALLNYAFENSRKLFFFTLPRKELTYGICYKPGYFAISIINKKFSNIADKLKWSIHNGDRM